MVITNLFDGGEGEVEAMGELDAADDRQWEVAKENGYETGALRTAGTERPVVEIWAIVSGGAEETTTMAMDFMGWTSMERPKSKVVAML